MNLVKKIKVRILDHEYLLKSEENIEQVNEIAKYVNEKLKEIKDNTADLTEKKTAILAALNIASEYFQIVKERDELLKNIRKRTKTLLYHIDSVMG